MKRLKMLLFSVVIIPVLGCSQKTQTTEDENADTVLPVVEGYPIVGTGQQRSFNNINTIATPSEGGDFYGQDANYQGTPHSYVDNGNGTIIDNVTGLMWQKSPDTNGDGEIRANDKLSYSQAVENASKCNTGGYTDWRLPTIKEQYSLINFEGTDPSSLIGNDVSGLTPFIDVNFFDFAYGDINANERIIDSQYATSSVYVYNTSDLDKKLFGVNFADGRIKGYDMKLMGQDKTFFVIYVRGNNKYGVNDFIDNTDGTITDNATGLMWMQSDNSTAMKWKDALEYAEGAEFAGHSDWRLPNAKELQSLVDYTRCPDLTSSATISPLFKSTQITNEAGQIDYPCYWTGTTHISSDQLGANAVYVAFGRAMGYMSPQMPPIEDGDNKPLPPPSDNDENRPPIGEAKWMDVHGAGSQRSDPKDGDPADFETGLGPQGDAIRINNYVRLVRNVVAQ